ncbi:MAG: hypothetical protein GW815_00970, partial [Candidatus Moranbacteria bacterium]|nr:hypothetical protein [Candidatus Moranbacteria bacterium]
DVTRHGLLVPKHVVQELNLARVPQVLVTRTPKNNLATLMLVISQVGEK